MKALLTLVLFSTLTVASSAQIAPAPGIPPVAQAQQAFQVVQAQSMIMTNQAQLQGLIAAQAGMMNSAMARSMFLAQAASLQVRVTANQSAIFASQAAAINSMQRSLVLQKQLLAQSAMLHAVAAQTSGQTASSQAEAPPASPDADLPAAEPPPMMIRPTFGNALIIESQNSPSSPARSSQVLRSASSAKLIMRRSTTPQTDGHRRRSPQNTPVPSPSTTTLNSR